MKEKYLLDSNILIHHQRDYQNRELDFTLVRAKAKETHSNKSASPIINY